MSIMPKNIEHAVHVPSTRRLRIVTLFAIILVVGFYMALALSPGASLKFPTHIVGSWLASPQSDKGTGISIADCIYVISLKSRQDRRAQMDVLAEKLGLQWSYMDATPATDSLVNATLEWLRESRAAIGNLSVLGSSADGGSFTWPTDIDALVESHDYLDSWDATNSPNLDGTPMINISGPTMYAATGNNTLTSDTSQMPSYMVLSPSRIACWHSHLRVIHLSANAPPSWDSQQRPLATLVLEDDIDMEENINAQLSHLWSYLPVNWDIIFLGHCWSNESFHPAIPFPSSSNMSSYLFTGHTHDIHPSHYPKCTHAYALSHNGARRLLLHLRHPPFAYSRAIDQAIAWLVQTKRLKSFSIVPSIVIQRKLSKSDVWAGTGEGSSWREELFHGVLSRLK